MDINYILDISQIISQDIGYNFTRLPNQFNHETQEEVII